MKKILLSVLILCLAFAGTLPVGAEASLSVGDIVLFGRYEQDNDPADGPEEIEWIVLDIRDGSVKLRLDGQVRTVRPEELDSVSADAAAVIRAVIRDYPWLLPG